MSERTVIFTDQAPKALGPYSQAIKRDSMIFASGQVAIDPSNNEFLEGDVATQTRRALENLTAVLAAAGTDLAHVMKTTVFLLDMGDFAAMNEVYATFFATNPPARSTVAVAGLPKGARVEIECIAIAD